jgi:hypothetical protein
MHLKLNALGAKISLALPALQEPILVVAFGHFWFRSEYVLERFLRSPHILFYIHFHS